MSYDRISYYGLWSDKCVISVFMDLPRWMFIPDDNLRWLDNGLTLL